MPTQDYIDVTVRVDGQPLTEYTDPDQPDGIPMKEIRYIEVKTGQQFSVNITLLPSFDFKHAKHVCWECEVDQDPCQWYGSFRSADVCTFGGVLQGSKTDSVVGADYQDKETGKWHEHSLVFGVLGLNESDISASSLSAADIESIGSIRVKVFRARREKSSVPYVWPGEMPDIPDELPEKALKGKALKNNVKYDAKHVVLPPKPFHYDYLPIEGNHGQAYEFKFLYRNRKILQHIGCIPRSPSPAPDLALMLERTEDMLRHSKQEAQDAKLRIKQLEERDARRSSSRFSGSVTEPEADDATVVASRESSVKSGAKQGTKRDRNNRDTGESNPKPLRRSKRLRPTLNSAGEDQELIEMPPPPKKPQVLVDLTRGLEAFRKSWLVNLERVRYVKANVVPLGLRGGKRRGFVIKIEVGGDSGSI